MGVIMIKYIVEQKEYFDRTFGNTYFSARVIDTEGKEVLRLPFQYGYGSHCQTLAAKALNCAMDELFVSLTKGTQAEVKSWGHTITGPYRVIIDGKGKTYETMPEVYSAIEGKTAKVKDSSGLVFIQRK